MPAHGAVAHEGLAAPGKVTNVMLAGGSDNSPADEATPRGVGTVPSLPRASGLPFSSISCDSRPADDVSV